MLNSMADSTLLWLISTTSLKRNQLLLDVETTIGVLSVLNLSNTEGIFYQWSCIINYDNIFVTYICIYEYVHLFTKQYVCKYDAGYAH